MSKITSADPSRMTGEMLARRFHGGKFSLKNFLRDCRDEIPEDIVQSLKDEKTFKTVEQSIQSIDSDMLRWLWGDGMLTEDDKDDLCMYSEEEFREDAEAAKEHVLGMTTGDIAYMAFFDKEIDMLDDTDWMDEIAQEFFNRLLESINSNVSEIDYSGDNELYDEFMEFMAKALVEMAPNQGFEVLDQLMSNENKVSTKECRKLDKVVDDWFDKALEFNSAAECIRWHIGEFVGEMDDIISELDQEAIKTKLREFAKDHASCEWADCATAIAAIAYAAL